MPVALHLPMFALAILLGELPPQLPAQACASESAQQLAHAAAAVQERFSPPQPPQTAQIAGLTLTDDPRALEILRRSLGALPPRSWARASTCVAARQATVLCALTAVLGSQESALWLLAIGAESGAVPSLDRSPWKSGAEARWQPGDLRALALALFDLPPQLKHLSNLRAFRQVPEGESVGNHANAFSSISDACCGPGGSIWLAQAVWRMPPRQVREVIAHESGHQYEFSRDRSNPHSISHSAQWLSLSHWRSTGAPADVTAFRLTGDIDIGTSGDPPIPSEDFPDSVDNYRYQPRLLRAYSKAKYEWMKQHVFAGNEYLQPRPFPEVDDLLRSIGGPLAAITSCSQLIQRASHKPGSPQASLFVVKSMPGGGTEWANWFRSAFVQHSPCFVETMAKLRALPQWSALTCHRDPEEIAMAVGDRLEDAWGSFTEATGAIASAAATLAPGCESSGHFTTACFAGPAGLAQADAQARRLLSTFPASDASPAAALAKLLLTQTPLAPPDETFFQLAPLLDDPKELLAACVLGAVEVSSEPGKDNWRYWVRLPPRNQIRGFDNPIWTAACERDYAAALRKAGVAVDEADPLFQHWLFVLRNQSGATVDRFASQVLRGWSDLLLTCGIPGGTKASPSQRGCAKEWLTARLQGLAPADEIDALAQHLAEQLRGP